MFKQLKEINKKPKLFEFYTAEALWADTYRAQQMLFYHLNKELDLASRNAHFIQKSTNWIINQFNITTKSRIGDFGCAVGLYTTAFAKTGARVTGIDFSINSLEYAKEIARKQHLEINYVHKNYLEYDSNETYDLITMIMCDFCVLSPEQRKVLLSKFHKLLADDGSVLLDVQSLNAFDRLEESSSYELNHLNRFWAEDDYYAFVNTFKYPEENVSLDQYTIFEKDETYTVYNWFQYYSVETLKREFEEAGFTINAVYKNVAGEAYCDNESEFAVIVKKL